METLKTTGVLEFLTWDRPWKLAAESGCVDLRERFWSWAVAAKGKPSIHNYDRFSYSLGLAAESDTILEFSAVGDGVLLTKRDGFGFSNIAAYLSMALQMLNGRRCAVLISEDGFSISADDEADPTIHGVMYCDGNSARVDDEGVERVCRPGAGKDTCIFLTMSPKGWRCQKFDSLTCRHLLSRHADGQMNAGRIGNCKLLGREPEAQAT